MSLNITNEELIKLVTKLVIKELSSKEIQIPLGVSNRHIHLCREDMDILFGKGSQLTKLKDLKQPGQYACKETLIIKGPKGEISKVRILGPLRKDTQIEISITDSFSLGVKSEIRESGKLHQTPGLELIGPCGKLDKLQGTIVAYRHIHMPTNIANKLSVKDKDLVNVEIGEERGAILKNVLVRVSDDYALEMHLDLDEANGLNVKNNDKVKIV